MKQYQNIRKKRAVGAALALMLLLALCAPVTVFADTPAALPVPGTTGHYVRDLIAVAQSQIGYMEESLTHRTVYSDWAGQIGRPWCSEFASWCADQAGIPRTIFPARNSIGRFRSFFSEINCFYLVEGGYEYNCPCREYAEDRTLPLTELRPGDILLIETNHDIDEETQENDADHTALCIGIYGNRVLTIEGNVDRSKDSAYTGNYKRTTVSQKTRSASEIHGVCRPIYDNFCSDSGHNWDDGVLEREASCSEEKDESGEGERGQGLILYTCLNCSETRLQRTGRLDHTVETDPAVEPTCTDMGLTEGSHCSVCGKILKVRETIPAKGHDWAEETVRLEPNAVRDGVREMYCRVCGESKLETIPATGAPVEGTILTHPVTGASYTVTRSGVTGGTVAYTSAGSRSVKSVTVPSSVKLDGITYRVTSLADRAFFKCTKLTDVTLPSSVTRIGSRAFYKCTRLRSLTIKTRKLTKKKVGSNAFRGSYAQMVVHVPSGKAKAYRKILRAKGAGKQVTVR